MSESDDPEKQRELLEMDTDAPTKLAHKLGGEPKFKVSCGYTHRFKAVYVCVWSKQNLITF